MAPLKRFLKYIWIRTLKIDILTLFISLITIAFICVITYSYIKNYYAILNFSKTVMKLNSKAIVDDVHDIQKNTQETLEDSEGIFLNNNNFSINDRQTQVYMLNTVKINPDISSFFIAFPSGQRILVKKVASSSQTHFITQPQKPLPAGTEYCLKITTPNTTPYPEVWYYTDRSFNILAQEKLTKPTVVIFGRPWFNGALSTQKIFWSEPYHYLITNDLGITASKALYNKSTQWVAIVGVDLSFIQISEFLKNEKIGKSGLTFITDPQGNILISPKVNLRKSKISPEVVHRAVAYYQKSHKDNFSFTDGHYRFLSYVGVLPSIFGKHWLIVTVVPFSEFFSELISTQLQIIGISIFILLLCILIIYYFSKRISSPITILSKEIDKITNLDLSSRRRVYSHIVEIRMIDASIAAMRSAIRSFSRYVPKQIVKELLAQKKDITLHVEKKRLTILFTDIQDFTGIAEKEPLNLLMSLLNEYFDGLSKIILDNQGTIDKYIGDSIMAFWGAPSANPHHAIFACKTALKCQAFSTVFNNQCLEQKKPQLNTRFGISSGTVMVGNIGTEERMNYTVLGDAVNTAARLQATDKIYHVSIIISEEVYLQTAGEFLVRPLDTIEVKGKHKKIKIYELVAWLHDDPEIGATETQKELCATFSSAYEKYIEGDFVGAKKIFQAILEKFPNDFPTQFYLDSKL